MEGINFLNGRKKERTHWQKKIRLKKRMNKIPFGKNHQKTMHKWSVLENYTFSSVRFFRVPYSKLKETCIMLYYWHFMGHVYIKDTSYFPSSELEALKHFLFSKKLDQALKRTYNIIAKSFAALPSFDMGYIIFSERILM